MGKNENFVQLYRDHMPELRWLMKKSGTASVMFNFILEQMDEYNALVCSQKVFMEQFNISKDTVRRCIKLLKDEGFLDILKSGTNNVYVVNQEIAWTTDENKKTFCKFGGNIILRKSENINYNKRNSYDRLKALKEREEIK